MFDWEEEKKIFTITGQFVADLDEFLSESGYSVEAIEIKYEGKSKLSPKCIITIPCHLQRVEIEETKKENRKMEIKKADWYKQNIKEEEDDDQKKD